MQVIIVKSIKEKLKYIKFRKEIYKKNAVFVDDNMMMIKQLFYSRTRFSNKKKIFPMYVLGDDNEIKCQCIAIYTKELPDYIQMSFFEGLDNEPDAVQLLIKEVSSIGKKYSAQKLVVGLAGHVNYGLGMLANKFDSKNSFGMGANPEYYNDYFKNLDFEEVFLNTYLWSSTDSQRKMERFSPLIDRVDENYEYKFFDKENFDYFSKIYTDLNNECFKDHRYYYSRNYEEDKEMLKELLTFIHPESLIFAFKDNKPAGFIMWYLDLNELVSPGKSFGTITYLKSLFLYKKIKKAKIIEMGVVEEHRSSGLILGLIKQACIKIRDLGISGGESSWVLEENKDSNSICKAFCNGLYKKYVVYEKNI